MNKHVKKMIAPIIIITIIVIYYFFIGGVLLLVDNMPFPAKILCLIIPTALTGVGIFVLVERIKEIRSGEEDDLSKY